MISLVFLRSSFCLGDDVYLIFDHIFNGILKSTYLSCILSIFWVLLVSFSSGEGGADGAGAGAGEGG